MAIGRVVSKNVVLFPDFDDFEYGKDDEFWEMELFLQIPNLTKVDILEYFEYRVFCNTTPKGRVECDFNLVPMSYLDSNNEIIENDSKPSYISEHINIIGQLFLAGYIDFGSYYDNDDREKIDYPTNLSCYKEDKYQAWIYFRDSFFYTDAYYRDIIDLREKYPNMSDDDYFSASWDTPQYWNRDRFWIARTPKGDEYFEKVLEPRFYNKYKDLEVEIDSKGNIVRWIGRINR